MERTVSQRRWPWAVLAAGMALVAAGTVGCRGLLSTVAYLVKGTNVDAAYDGLKNQKVAVVVHSTGPKRNPDQEYGGRELAEQVGDLLQANVRGIKVVDQQSVQQWRDNLNNDKDDDRAMGQALEVDAVVAIELEDFRLSDNSTSLYTGRADYRIVVYDLKKEGKVAYDHTPTEPLAYPPQGGIPIGNRSRASFRKIFVRELAEEVSRHFYPHDSMANFARESTTLQYH